MPSPFIDVIDLYEDFVSAADSLPGGSKDLYLYADAMHFSSMGHLVAYRAMSPAFHGRIFRSC